MPSLISSAAAQPDESMELVLDEPIPLETLVAYVGRELQISFLYEPDLLGGEIQLVMQGPMPRSALEGVLGTALRMKQLAVVRTGVAGIKRIVSASEGSRLAGVADAGDGSPPVPGNTLTVVTRAFRLKYVIASMLGETLRPMLASPESVVLVSDEQGLVVVADQADVIERVAELIQTIDQPGEKMTMRTRKLEHAVARDVAENVSMALQAKLGSDGRFDMQSSVVVTADPRSNRLVMVVPGEMVETLDTLIDELDQPVDGTSAPIRHYKLTNTKAREVLQTLRAVAGLTNAVVGDGFADRAGGADRRADAGSAGSADDGFGPSGDDGFGYDDGSGAGDGFQDDAYGGPSGDGLYVDTGISAGSLNGRKVTLAADVNTNSIIVVADAATHQVFADLIERLDERRPQVQIEATLVSLNTTNDYSLGVQFGTQDDSAGGRLVTFSAFGIAGVDPATGVLAPLTGTGLTAALLDTDFADVVLRAFQEDGNSRVLSAPTLLVNDNERGVLRSIREEPTTTVTQGEVSDQVSFRGFVEAGTKIVVTPNISDGGYLQLEYRVEVNSFLPPSVDSGAGVPPPRQTDSIGSRVTIPDGYTVVAGGLTRHDFSDTVQKVPLLGDLPLLGELFRNRTKQDNEITLFVFLKPTILRDDDFADLRALSDPRLRDAGLAGNDPWDGPELILD